MIRLGELIGLKQRNLSMSYTHRQNRIPISFIQNARITVYIGTKNVIHIYKDDHKINIQYLTWKFLVQVLVTDWFVYLDIIQIEFKMY